MKRPLLVCPPEGLFKDASLVSVLGALQALYVVSKYADVTVPILYFMF